MNELNDSAIALLVHLKDAARSDRLRSDDRHFSDTPYPPLCEEEILHAEQELGFSLSPFIRSVYTEVANGGFGPSYGLLGLKGGMLNEEGDDAIGQYLAYRKPWPEEPHWEWPEGLLPVGHLGCAMYLCVDCTKPDGPIVWFEPNPHEEGESWESSFIPLANSTEEWIGAWFRGEDLFDKLVSQD